MCGRRARADRGGQALSAYRAGDPGAVRGWLRLAWRWWRSRTAATDQLTGLLAAIGGFWFPTLRKPPRRQPGSCVSSSAATRLATTTATARRDETAASCHCDPRGSERSRACALLWLSAGALATVGSSRAGASASNVAAYQDSDNGDQVELAGQHLDDGEGVADGRPRGEVAESCCR